MRHFWAILFGAVMAAAFLLTAVSPLLGWWLPKNVSTFGAGIDLMFYVILAVTAIFFVLTEVILVYALYRYAGRPEGKSEFVHGNHRLQVIWTLIPGLLLFLLAVGQIKAWAEVKYQSRMPKPDGKTLQMEVLARQWEWRVRYPSVERMKSWEANPALAQDFRDNPHFDDVRIANEIHTWKGAADDPQRVLVHLLTQDVLHSFFLPNLRLKQDALPGKTIPVWFAAQEANTVYDPATRTWRDGYNPDGKDSAAVDSSRVWELACAEFCGARHSMMRGKLFVHEDKSAFMRWLEQTQALQNQKGISDPTVPPAVAAQ